MKVFHGPKPQFKMEAKGILEMFYKFTMVTSFSRAFFEQNNQFRFVLYELWNRH